MFDRSRRALFAVLQALAPAITLGWLLAILWLTAILNGGHL